MTDSENPSKNAETVITVDNENLINNSDRIKSYNDISKNEEKKKGISKLCIFLIIFLILLLGLIGYICYYFGTYYHATNNALKYMKGNDEVQIFDEDLSFHFQGPGKDKALIFYQGAKVQEEAYAEILYNLAKNGIDCFLVKMPFHFALFGKNKATEIINNNKELYDKWYIAGHSLGGAMAAMYAADHSDNIDGLALLAAYSTKKLSDKLKVVSIVGTNDKVLKWDNYDKNKVNLPSNYTEVLIEKGNHGQFGDYGFQKGDGVSEISVEEQHKQVVDAIIEKFNN